MTFSWEQHESGDAAAHAHAAHRHDYWSVSQNAHKVQSKPRLDRNSKANDAGGDGDDDGRTQKLDFTRGALGDPHCFPFELSGPREQRCFFGKAADLKNHHIQDLSRRPLFDYQMDYAATT
ncbi:hypothetical protein AWENTII_007468 [Aspergillus wentii]|nr:hypothetical protein MW887_011325 [Aspergillus wentii]